MGQIIEIIKEYYRLKMQDTEYLHRSHYDMMWKIIKLEDRSILDIIYYIFY